MRKKPAGQVVDCRLLDLPVAVPVGSKGDVRPVPEEVVPLVPVPVTPEPVWFGSPVEALEVDGHAEKDDDVAEHDDDVVEEARAIEDSSISSMTHPSSTTFSTSSSGNSSN